MKNVRLLLGVILLGIVSFCVFSVYDYVTMSANDRFLLANIEALTQDEGTAVGYCYVDEVNGPKEKRVWFDECNWNTSASRIFPCPERSNFGIKGNRDRCTN